MRCPKCGYISFDHVENCLKCKKNIADCTEAEGTTYHAAPPSFLRVPAVDESVDESSSSQDMAFEDDSEESYDFSDPDLDVLVDDDGEEISIEEDNEDVVAIDEAELADVGGDFQLDTDENEEGFAFDMEGDEEEAAAPSLNVPDELSDISDLAPPEKKTDSGAGVNLSLDDEVSMDEDLDLDGLDLDLGLGGDSAGAEADLSLSLDDIDLSTGGSLDLGGLGDSPDSKKEKSAGNLDDLSLSLD